MHRYKELKIWQEAMNLVQTVYQMTQGFASDEKYGLSSQIRRSAVSIPSNIAEEAGRNNQKEFNHFLGISSGSSSELSTQLEIAKRLNFLNEEKWNEIEAQIKYIQKMIYKLQMSIQKHTE